MSSVDTNTTMRMAGVAEARHSSAVLEDAVSILRRAISSPVWDARFVKVETPLPMLAVGVLESLVDAVAEEDAVYWAQPLGETVVGLGAAQLFEAHGSDRYARLRAAAAALPSWARLFAGFAFQAGGPASDTFGDARALLPRFLVRDCDDNVTLSVVLDREHHDEQTRTVLRDQLDRIVARLRQPAPTLAFHAIERVGEPRDEAVAFVTLVERARTSILRGELEKVVVHRQTRVVADGPRAASGVLRHLAISQPTSVRFAFRIGGTTFLGATPERLVRRTGRSIKADVLAGSLPRDVGTEMPDALLASGKDLAEHELTRRAIVEVLTPRCSVLRQDGPSVHSLPHLFHLHTSVDGELLGNDHVLDLVEALHPTPAVGGAPRAAALAFIAANEPVSRGWYAAPIGWFLPNGDGDFAVALRCATISGSSLTLYAGAGIVADSDPRTELGEIASKRRAIASALDIHFGEAERL